jgi:hypothetical protein
MQEIIEDELELRIEANKIENNCMNTIYKAIIKNYLHKCYSKGYVKKIYPIAYKNCIINGLHKNNVYLQLMVTCKICVLKPTYNTSITVSVDEINKSCIIAKNGPITCIIIGLNSHLFTKNDTILVKIIETQIIKKDNIIRCTSKYIKHV